MSFSAVLHWPSVGLAWLFATGPLQFYSIAWTLSCWPHLLRSLPPICWLGRLGRLGRKASWCKRGENICQWRPSCITGVPGGRHKTGRGNTSRSAHVLRCACHDRVPLAAHTLRLERQSARHCVAVLTVVQARRSAAAATPCHGDELFIQPRLFPSRLPRASMPLSSDFVVRVLVYCLLRVDPCSFVGVRGPLQGPSSAERARLSRSRPGCNPFWSVHACCCN